MGPFLAEKSNGRSIGRIAILSHVLLRYMLRRLLALPEALLTVWYNVMERGRLSAGETVLIHGGSSGIGRSSLLLWFFAHCNVKTEGLLSVGHELTNYIYMFEKFGLAKRRSLLLAHLNYNLMGLYWAASPSDDPSSDCGFAADAAWSSGPRPRLKDKERALPTPWRAQSHVSLGRHFGAGG